MKYSFLHIRYQLSIWALLLTLFSSEAQVIEWSPPQKHRQRNNYTRILGANSSGYYLLRCRNNDFAKDVYLERYRSSLTLDFSKELVNGNKSRFENMILYEGGLLLFRSVDNKATEKIDLLVARVDENGAVANNWVKVDESPKKSHGDHGDFTVVPSANKDLIVCSHTEYGAKNQSVLSITVFNALLQQQFVRKFDLEYASDNLRYNELQIDDYGNVYFSAIHNNQDKKKNSSEYKEHFMYAFLRSADKLNKYRMDEANYYIRDFSFGVNYVKKCLTICGFYSNEGNTSVAGTFLYNMDLDSGVVFYHHFQEFDKALVAKLLGEKEASKKSELSNIEMRKLVMRSDGGMILAAENTYITQQTYTYYVNGIPQYSYRNIYNYDDILVVSLDPDGKPEWEDVIRKKQSSMNDDGYFSSFTVLPFRDKMHFIYNDNTRGNGNVVDVSINNKGEKDKSVLLNSKNTYALIAPSESKLVGYSSMILSAMKDRQYSLLKITF